MKVEITELKKVMEFLMAIESVSLDKITWTENGKEIPVSPADLEEWKFTGLNNRDFAKFIICGSGFEKQ